MNPAFRITARKSDIGQGLCALSLFACMLLSGVALFAPAGGARAQSVNDVQARLNRIENEIQTLSRAMFRGEQPPQEFFTQQQSAGGGSAAAQADLDVRLSRLENDLRTLTGKVEEQSFRVGQMQTRLDKALSDMEMRLKALESQSRVAMPPPGAGNEGMAAGMQTVTPYAPPSPPAGGAVTGSLGTLSQAAPGAPSSGVSAPPAASADSATAAYGQAFATLQGGDYAGAAQAFEGFLAKYPDDPLAANAQYWLGESYYARQDYTQSARVFAEAYRKYPKSAKTPDNLLKLALSLAGQGNKDDACVALGQLRKQFPDGAGPVLARAAEESKKLACP